MSGTLYGFPRGQMYDGVPVVPGPVSPSVTEVPESTGLHLNPWDTAGPWLQTVMTDPPEDPGFRPLRAVLVAVLLVDIVLAVLIASVWR